MKKIQNIYERAVASLKKHHVVYETTKGKKYKTVKVLYYIACAFALFTTLAYLLGQFFIYQDSINSKELLKPFLKQLFIFTPPTVLFIAGMFFAAFKKDLVALILTVVPTIFKLIAFLPLMKNVDMHAGIHPDYWWHQLLPGILCIIFSVIFATIKLRADYIENRAYKNLIETIYNQYNVTDLNEDEWKDFLKNYDPRKIEEDRRRSKKNKSYSPMFNYDNDKK